MDGHFSVALSNNASICSIVINTNAIDVHARCGQTISPNVDKESGERGELFSVEFVCWTLDLPVRLFTDFVAGDWQRRWYRGGGCR